MSLILTFVALCNRLLLLQKSNKLHHKFHCNVINFAANTRARKQYQVSNCLLLQSIAFAKKSRQIDQSGCFQFDLIWFDFEQKKKKKTEIENEFEKNKANQTEGARLIWIWRVAELQLAIWFAAHDQAQPKWTHLSSSLQYKRQWKKLGKLQFAKVKSHCLCLSVCLFACLSICALFSMADFPSFACVWWSEWNYLGLFVFIANAIIPKQQKQQQQPLLLLTLLSSLTRTTQSNGTQNETK